MIMQIKENFKRGWIYILIAYLLVVIVLSFYSNLKINLFGKVLVASMIVALSIHLLVDCLLYPHGHWLLGLIFSLLFWFILILIFGKIRRILKSKIKSKLITGIILVLIGSFIIGLSFILIKYVQPIFCPIYYSKL